MSMTVVGGCYHEICEHPFWRELRGSGGRAAIALSSVAPDVELRTYYPNERLADLHGIEAFGVSVRPMSSETPVAFAYFHSLSDPVVSPAKGEIRKGAPIRAEGEVVLRFGLLEGSAIVEAARAIYDPQTAVGFEPFAKNGSRASKLAVVLNERELLGFGGNDIQEEASRIFSRDRASVLIVKRGIKGAIVFNGSDASSLIPA
jgi:hypothetical protein